MERRKAWSVKVTAPSAGELGLQVASADLDVHVLVEGAREAVAGNGEDAPAPPVVGGAGDGGVVRAIGEPEERQGLDRAIQHDRARRAAGVERRKPSWQMSCDS
jgi:hypothetical protein